MDYSIKFPRLAARMIPDQPALQAPTLSLLLPMPTHPLAACYCHVLDAGLKNIARLLKRGAAPAIENELTHLREVNRILTDYLLHYPHDGRYSASIHELTGEKHALFIFSGLTSNQKKRIVVAGNF